MARAPARTVIAQLAAYGLSPGTIATIFDIDVEKVRNAVEDLPIEAAVRDDGDLRTGVRRVAWRVIEETMLMLDEGSPAVKQRMITNLFTKMMSVLTEESSQDMSTLRDQLAIMVSEMSVLPDSAEEEQPDPESDEPE